MKTKTWSDIGNFKCPTWDDIGNPTLQQRVQQMELSVRATWWAVDKDEDEIKDEVIRRLTEKGQ